MYPRDIPGLYLVHTFLENLCKGFCTATVKHRWAGLATNHKLIPQKVGQPSPMVYQKKLPDMHTVFKASTLSGRKLFYIDNLYNQQTDLHLTASKFESPFNQVRNNPRIRES